MSIYVVTGKLGAGKSLLAVSRIRHYLREGRRVATNLDLTLENMLDAHNRAARVMRIPDKPTAGDLDAIGLGADILDESRYGLLVLDELGTWLNARSWGDKDRQGVIDWLIHSRKRRWDVILLVQNQSMMDKQVREALLEYLVTCKRLDKVKVPVLGALGKWLSLGAWNGCIGRVHLGVVVYAAGTAILANALVVERWLYRGVDLFRAYDTEQVFSSTYAHGLFSYLTPWHVVGRHLPHVWTFTQRVALVCAAFGLGPMGGWPLERVAARLRAQKAASRGPVTAARSEGRRGPQMLPVARAVNEAFRRRRAAAAPGGLSI